MDDIGYYVVIIYNNGVLFSLDHEGFLPHDYYKNMNDLMGIDMI